MKNNVTHRYDRRATDDMREDETCTIYCHVCKTWHKVVLVNGKLETKP